MRPSFAISSFVAALALAAVAGVACKAEATDTPDPAGTYAGGTDGGVPACTSCLATECVGVWAACLTAPGCQAAQACGTYRAFAACNDARSGGTCLADCKAASKTAPACEGGDAGDAGTVDGCTSCVSGKCGDAKRSCALGTECAAYLACAYAAKDAAGAEDCGRLHATGKAAAVELATCTNAGCTDACGF